MGVGRRKKGQEKGKAGKRQRDRDRKERKWQKGRYRMLGGERRGRTKD